VLPKPEISDFKFQISECTAETNDNRNDIGSENEFRRFGTTPFNPLIPTATPAPAPGSDAGVGRLASLPLQSTRHGKNWKPELGVKRCALNVERSV